MKLRFIYFLLGLSLFFNHTIAQPTVSSVTYNVTTGTLSVTGSNFEAIADVSDIDASRISLFGQGNTGYFLTTDNSVERTDAEHFSIVLTGTQKTAVDNILNRNGSSAWDGNNFRIEFAASWNSGSSSATSAFISVEGVLSPQITSAEFNFGNGNLVITGTNLKNTDGANNDIDVTKLTISDGTISYTLTGATPSAEIVGNQAILVVQGVDKSMLNYILNRDGTTAESGLLFGIAADAGWNGFGESDPGTNTLTVTSYLKPQVSSVAYDASTGIFTVTGSYMSSVTGSSNDIDASKLQITGYQGVTYSLSTAFSVDLINETSFKIYLSGVDRTQVEVLLNRNGTSAWGGVSYNLQLDDGWNSGILGSADLTNAITVSGALNQPPKVLNVNLGGDLINDKVLSLSFDYFDLEEDPAGSHTIEWYTYTDNLGGGKTLITDITGTSYTLRAQDIGLFINAEITPVAQTGTLTGTMVSSPVRGPVLNAPPYATEVTVTGSLYLKNTISGNFNYKDLENNPIGICTYKWYRASTSGGPDEEITGETSLTYKITETDLNKFISFEVIPIAQSGTLQGIPVKSGRFEVQNEAPKASDPLISGSRYKNQEVTAEYTYSDLESDPQGASTFKWFRSSDINGPDEEISSVTSKTYVITADDLNKYISFEVTPVAQTGNLTGAPIRSARYQVENEKPKASSVYISGNLYLNQDISGNYAYSDLEIDPQGASTFQWYRADSENGPDVEITDATQTTYKIVTADLNKYISFKVWPKAASGTIDGDPVQSPRLDVKNEKPKATTVDFLGNMYLSNTLTGTYLYSDLESDNPGISTFKWYRADNSNGPDTEIVGETQITYTLASQDLNKYISFEVTPVAISGDLTGSPVRSSRKAVLNEAPKANSLTVIGNRVLGQTLLANFVFTDLENDNEGVNEFQWYISDAATGPDVLISGSTSKTFEITRQYLGKYISFRVTPKALTGTITGEQKTSERFYINEAPKALNVSINGSFRIKQELQGVYTYADAENDPEGTSEFHWYRSDNADGTGKVLIVGENTSKYTVRFEDMNKYISFEVTPKANSGSLQGVPFNSSFLGPVANSVPIATNVRISGTQLVCKSLRGEYNYEDLEGDPEGDSQFKWYRASSINGVKTLITGETGREYKLTVQDQGMYIFFEVLPRAISGTTSGSPTLSSPTGSIVNTLPTVTILGTSSICSGSTARLTISFTGSAPWKLSYTDGTQKYQLVSSDPVYLLNVNKGGTYKADTLVDNIGCPVTDLPSTATISILPLPQVEIVGVNNAYNLRGNPVQLAGNPTGGTFSGPGVIPSTSMFYPSIAGTQNSPHTIIYEYRSPQTGCSNRDTIMIEVVDADASISGLRTGGKYCNFDTPFVITGTNAIGSVGSFAITGGVGLKDNNNNTATINPSDLSAGNYTISYSYFDGIQLTIYKDISIEILDEARIFGITGTTYCSNSAPMEIYSNYIGGTFSGNAVFKNSQTNKYYFNPALDVPGNTMVTFTYATSYGCVVSKSVDKFIAPVPTAEFSVINNCYNGDSTAFKNKTLSDITISKWDWRFGDSQSSEANNRSALFEPKHKYPSIGNRNVRLIAENIYGCKDTVDKIIHLGDIPTADFGWYSECFVKGYPVSFKNKSTNIDEITKYKWVVEDTSKLDFNYSIKDILHTFPVIRDYTVNFKVTTEYGCSDSVKKVIRLRPIFYLRDTFYSNNFEVGKDYWLPTDSLMVNNWKFGTPNGTKINTAASGSKAYYTSLKDTRKNQQLIITSPCFNLKGMTRPFISLETYSDVAKGTEGTVLQYSEDNGISWQNVGGFNTGINWYNDFAIQSQPGGQQIGWSDKFTGWTNARHNLDQIKTDSMIRFRVVFGQNSKATGNDGFAFDNVVIANRIKKVLFEHFTNNSQVVSLKANLFLDSVVALNNEDAVAIQYHTSFPGIDTFNMHNSSDPGSRVLYYGIGITPNAYLEGGTESRYIYDFNNKMPNTADIKNLSMKDVSFKLDLKVDKSSSKVSGILGIAALKQLTGRTISARIIVVEDIVSQIAGGQITYRNVVRKILPSAGGTVLSSSWDTGKKESVNFSWDYRNVYNPAKVHIVAFLQDELTRDIYQVVSDDTSKVSDDPGVGIKISERNVEVNVYPNPAKDLLVVEFSEIPNNDQRIEIWSTNGKMVLSEKLFKGVSRFEADVQNFNNGLYFVRILDKTRVLATKKLVIMH